MGYYKQVDEGTLRWREIRADVSQTARQLTTRVLNEILTDLDRDFSAAGKNGQILDFEVSKDGVKKYLLETAKKVWA